MKVSSVVGEWADRYYPVREEAAGDYFVEAGFLFSLDTAAVSGSFFYRRAQDSMEA